VSGKLHASATLSLRRNPVRIELETGWAPEVIWTFEERKISFASYRESNPRPSVGYPGYVIITIGLSSARSRGSVVGVLSRFRAGRPRNRGSIPYSNSSLMCPPERFDLSGDPPSTLFSGLWLRGLFSLWIKQPCHQAERALTPVWCRG
jgi:hypothetical protein